MRDFFRRTGDVSVQNAFSPVPACRQSLILRYAPWVLILLTVCIGFGYVDLFGVNVFLADEWDALLPLLSHYSDGTLTASELWKPHNEHRIFFPKLVMLGLGILTRGNIVAVLYLTQVLFTATLGVLWIALRRQFSRDRAIWHLVPLAFLVFDLRQWESMLMGMLIAFVMVMVAAWFTFLSLSRAANHRWAAAFSWAVVAAVVGSYSSIQGLLIWPVGVAQLLVAPLNKRLKIVLTSLWTSLGIFAWLVYFYDWSRPNTHPAFTFSWEYFFAAIGSSLSSKVTIAPWLGALLIGLAIAAVVLVAMRRQWGEQSFWLAAIAFSIGTAASITIGRAGFGVHQALHSRYSTFAIPLVIGIYTIFASQSSSKQNAAASSTWEKSQIASSKFCIERWLAFFSVQLAVRVLLVLVLIGTGVALAEGLRRGRDTKRSREHQQFVLYTIDSQPDSEITLYPRPTTLRKCVPVLEKMKYGMFADPERCAQYRQQQMLR
jgi:hypothetical protein